MDLCGNMLNQLFIKGIARTQSPTNKNYALELPTFGVIVGVSPTGVQWRGLALEEPPSWSRLTSVPGKYALLCSCYPPYSFLKRNPFGETFKVPVLDSLSMKISSDLFCMRFVRDQILVSFTVRRKVHSLLCRPLVSVWAQSYSLLLNTCCLPAPYWLLRPQKALGGIFLLLYIYTCPETKCLY